MRTWFTDWKYEVGTVCLIVIVAAAVLWNVIAGESPRYTVHHNLATKQVYVQLHRHEDRKEWRLKTGREEYRDKISFHTIQQACQWVNWREKIHAADENRDNAWREVTCETHD